MEQSAQRPATWGGTAVKTWLNFLFFFLVIYAYYIAKPIRNSLFLEWMGPSNLPYVYLFSAVVTLLGAFLLDLLLTRVAPLYLMPSAMGFFTVALGAFWWLFQVYDKLGASLSFVLYLFVSFMAVIAVSLFWATCNDTHTDSEGASTYHLIGLGGIVGGLAGSQTTAALATRIGTENLLLISAFIMMLAIPLPVILLRAWHRQTGTSPNSLVRRHNTLEQWDPRAIGGMLRGRYVLAIAAFVFLGTFLASLLDFQYQGIIKGANMAKDARTVFFGEIFLWMSLGGVAIHLLVTRPALRFVGPVAGLLPMPIIALFGAPALMATPTLDTVRVIGIVYGAFAYSMSQVTRETLYLRVPRETKYRAKFYIDTFVFRFGDAAVSLVLLFSFTAMQLPRSVLLSYEMVTAVFWIALILLFAIKARLLPWTHREEAARASTP
jgi:ATP:ADP antiporter, AAA family